MMRSPEIVLIDDSSSSFFFFFFKQVFAIYQILLRWKQYEYYDETVELSTTQGQPNPRNNRLKVALGPLFPTANSFSWVGIGFM